MKSFEDDALYRGNTERVKDARNISMVLVGNEIDILYQEVAIPKYARNYHVAIIKTWAREDMVWAVNFTH